MSLTELKKQLNDLHAANEISKNLDSLSIDELDLLEKNVQKKFNEELQRIKKQKQKKTEDKIAEDFRG